MSSGMPQNDPEEVFPPAGHGSRAVAFLADVQLHVVVPASTGQCPSGAGTQSADD